MFTGLTICYWKISWCFLYMTSNYTLNSCPHTHRYVKTLTFNMKTTLGKMWKPLQKTIANWNVKVWNPVPKIYLLAMLASMAQRTLYKRAWNYIVRGRGTKSLLTMSFHGIRSYTHKVLPAWVLHKVLPAWVLNRSCTEKQQDTTNGYGVNPRILILPKEEHTNWFSNSKCLVLQAYTLKQYIDRVGYT